MKLIVGLGNPGAKYAGTRHNVGFDAIEYLARSPLAGRAKAAFQSEVVELTEGTEKLMLMKPQTFMNLSGHAVRAALDFYKLTPADLMVMCDDFNLPLGKLRVRGNGSHGGQNGLRHIQEMLGTQDYPRLRIGVGQPGPGEAVDFVLSRFKPGERAAIDLAIAEAANAAMIWVRRGLPACMNAANGGPEANKPAKPKPPRPKPAGESKDETKPPEGG